MDTKLIEKLDRQRHWSVILQAVALLDILAETALFYILRWDPALPFLNIGGIVGLPLIVGAWIWYLAIEVRIARNPGLCAALHNEMYVVNKHRAQRIALWVVMCALLAGTLSGEFTLSIPGFIFCEVVFFLGLATLKVSWLVLNRNRR